ncbi:MAG: hypothetical protein KME28_13100 [Pelatocladus maniniholoensis HA4357-MV3]|uniref:Uncharacterized protein n=1 Tax=Pelatocladus maniniholoensis HA4357-MV3 TaxID=1117104 RepID=A0A9E3H7X6_9NOST|nr:hypothetical protein [Pelatocladus maniniholoensis HA4357-MV3]BAZ65559.1 hypothetical protein NIES4106_02980 [Fischerella sp. NIES-4106]
MKLREIALTTSLEVIKFGFILMFLSITCAVFSHGADRIEQAKGEEYQLVWRNRAKAFEGLGICATAVTAGAAVIGVVSAKT